MASLFDRVGRAWARWRCCPPPPKVTGVTAQAGGGSGEVVVTWDPLPASANVAFYRVYEKKLTGQYWHLAVVTTDALGLLAPNRLGVVDAADYWPGDGRDDARPLLRRHRDLDARPRRPHVERDVRLPRRRLTQTVARGIDAGVRVVERTPGALDGVLPLDARARRSRTMSRSKA